MSLLQEAIEIKMKTERQHHRLIQDRVRKTGLHRTSHITLMHLARFSGIRSQKEIAEHLSITPAAVTGILKNLERDGYIIRHGGRDARTNEIEITDLGRSVIEASRDAFYEIDTRLFDGFSDEELLAYVRALTKMNENMEKIKESYNEDMV